jgi:peroxiredoxin
MADYSEFQALNVQILGVSSSSPFAQKTFADSLKLPYPLLSDSPELKVIRSYGVLAPNQKDARRAFFLIDQQSVVREKWLPGDRTVFPSETVLAAVRAIAATR